MSAPVEFQMLTSVIQVCQTRMNALVVCLKGTYVLRGVPNLMSV